MAVKVLVVDDEVAIGISLRRLLRSAEVQCVASGAQALTLLAAGGRYEVIFVDVRLLDMSGLALLDAIGERAPDQVLRVVLITGGDAEAVRRDRPATPVLQKPFDPDEVRRLVQQLGPGGATRAGRATPT